MNTRTSREVPDHLREMTRPVFLITLGLTLASCAGQVFPPGGPIDTVPPRIVRTTPDSAAVHVRTQSIELEFSKYVDRRSVEESVFMSPYAGDLEFDWSGTSVRMTFSGTLKQNRTYVVNVGTDVKDLHANRMATGFTLAFSTGDSIDQGYIDGRVYDDKPEGVMIFAYALSGIDADTLDPARSKPDYIMQTGKAGIWTLSNLAFGPYRLYAIRDEYKNLLYDKGVDAYGVPDRDIVLSPGSPRVQGIGFRLTVEDTIRPFLTSVRAIDQYHLQARFSEPLDTLTFDRGKFVTVDTITNHRILPRVVWLIRSTPTLAGVELTSPVDSASTYRFLVSNINDPAGNGIDTAHAAFEFRGTNRADTARPTCALAGLRDSLRGVWIEQPFEVDFSKPVLHGPIPQAVVLTDSARLPLEVETRWLNETDLLLKPRRELMSYAWYRIRIDLDSVRDWRGNRPKDSTYVVRFQTIDLKTTGVIAGTLGDAVEDPAGGPLYLTATSIDLSPQRRRSIRLDQPGPFILNRLVEGKYTLDAFRDRDGSGAYTFGRIRPFLPSERFTVYPDTIKVRARWNVEGIRMVVPR